MWAKSCQVLRYLPTFVKYLSMDLRNFTVKQQLCRGGGKSKNLGGHLK